MKHLSDKEKKYIVGGAISLNDISFDEDINKNSVQNCICTFVNRISVQNVNEMTGYCKCVCSNHCGTGSPTNMEESISSFNEYSSFLF